MKKAFHAAALAILGGLIAYVPVRASAKDKTNLVRHYYCSPTRMARTLDQDGFIHAIKVDGVFIHFTDKNHTGKKPSYNAARVWLGFGRCPPEYMIVFMRDKYDASKHRHATKPPLLVSSKQPLEQVASVTRAGGTQPRTRADQKKLG